MLDAIELYENPCTVATWSLPVAEYAAESKHRIEGFIAFCGI